MVYTRNPPWVDNVTPVDAARMENIEEGLVTASIADPPPWVDSTFETTVNRWHGPHGTTLNWNSPSSIVSFYPMFFPRTITWHEVAVHVKTAGTQSPTGYVRLGLYDHTAAEVFTRIHDFGAIDGTTTGQKSIAGSWEITKGWHYTCVGITGWSVSPILTGSSYPTTNAVNVMGSANNTVPDNFQGYRGGWTTGTLLEASLGSNAAAYYGFPNFAFRRTS